MWSDKYNYYNIQSDEFLSKRITTKKLIEFLMQTSLFIQINHQTFCNSDKFPWVNITLLETKDGSFASSDTEIPFVNLISIVCSKEKETDQKIYIEAFLKLAKKLEWKLYLEEDDNGNEQVEIKQI